MTDLLEEAVATARGLPPEKQDEAAQVLLALFGDERRTSQLHHHLGHDPVLSE